MTTYQEYCEDFALYGDQAQEAFDSEFNASFDDIAERYAGERIDEDYESQFCPTCYNYNDQCTCEAVVEAVTLVVPEYDCPF